MGKLGPILPLKVIVEAGKGIFKPSAFSLISLPIERPAEEIAPHT